MDEELAGQIKQGQKVAWDAGEFVEIAKLISSGFDSPADALETYETKFGPIVMAKAALEPQGKWQALREDLARFFESYGRAEGGRTVLEPEYLVVTGGKPA